MDSLFIKIFDLFVNQRISRYEIDKAKYTKEILNEIKKKESFKKIRIFIIFHLNTIYF